MLSPLGQQERGGAMLLAACCLLGASILALGLWQESRIRHLADQVDSLREEVELLKLIQIQEEEGAAASEQYYAGSPRGKREAEPPVQLSTSSPVKYSTRFLSEDGIPIHSSKYKEGSDAMTRKQDLDAEDALGFKVYNAWFQHKREKDIRNDPRVVWSHPTDSPIRPYHRKSAAWTSPAGDNRDDWDEEEEEDDGDSFKKFGGSLYKDDSKKIKTNADANSINLGGNRAKITNPKEYQSSRQQVVIPTTSPPTTTFSSFSTAATATTAARRRPTMQIVRSSSNTSNSSNLVWNEHIANKIGLRQRTAASQAGGRSDEAAGRKRLANRDMLRSARARASSPALTGLTALHLQARLKPGLEGESRNRIEDTIFRDWTFARWAKRMRLDEKFPLKDGKLGVSSPGVYYIYAQVNYLDENDVNAFQIYINDSPYIMCTTMTHTPQFTTKANTCYTGGVVFLEQGDTLHVQNLEHNRYSVMLPEHTFFGLVQLAVAGI